VSPPNSVVVEDVAYMKHLNMLLCKNGMAWNITAASSPKKASKTRFCPDLDQGRKGMHRLPVTNTKY